MKVNFGRMLGQTAQQFSNKTALVNIEKGRSFTFMELHLLTNKICNMMRDHFGLKLGDVYGNLLENDNNSLLSIWMAKSEPTGLWFNYRDSFDEHMYQIDHCNPKLLFVEKEILDKEQYYHAFRERNIEIVSMERPPYELEGVHYFWDLVEAASDAEVNIEYDIDDHIILYRFTGGTTGRGKCAMYSLRNILGGVHQLYSHSENLIDSSIKFLHVTPLSHASALFMLPVYFKGGTHHTINVPDLNHLSSVVETHKITSTFVVPTLLYLIVDYGLEKKYDLSSLNAIFYGASPMSPAKLEILQEKFGNIFVQGYGSTEAWPVVSILAQKDHFIVTDEDRARLSSAGRPCAGVEVRIVNEHEIDVPVGTIGEIWLRGTSVIKGYYKNQEETYKGFSDGFWKSGDMGYMDEKGFIYIVDRKKDMIITGGFNVYAIEIESALNSHPAVQQSVVVGIPHEKWGEAVHCEVILNKEMQPSEEELILYLKGKVGKYKVPKSIAFVTELPVTPVGKVLRRKVRDKYWENVVRKV